MRAMRAALYPRVSTAAQDHALQLDELRQVAYRAALTREIELVASGVARRDRRDFCAEAVDAFVYLGAELVRLRSSQ